MKCIADFEVLSELSVAQNEKKLILHHPNGKFDVHIKNRGDDKAERQDVLSVQVLLDAVDLQSAEDIATDYLIQTMNVLSFVTNSRFEFHRILRIVDWTPGQAERQSLIFAGFDPADDPEPLLDDAFLTSAETLLGAEVNPALERALRWFRLGVGAHVLEPVRKEVERKQYVMTPWL